MFTRRKQDAVCLQGGDYKRPPPTNKTCGCTAADVECDYGYVMSGGTCMALPQVRYMTHSSMCPTSWSLFHQVSNMPAVGCRHCSSDVNRRLWLVVRKQHTAHRHSRGTC